MAADIKKMVEKISNLTVLELSKLIKALMDKFGLSTSGRDREPTKPDEGLIKPAPDPSPVVPEEVDKPVDAEEPTNSEKKSKPVDSSSVEVPNAKDEPVDEPGESEGYDPHIPTPEELGDLDDFADFDEDEDFEEDEDFDEDDLHVVYAWKWSGDDRHAKIGVSTERRLDDRIKKAKTYHPTDDPIPIGVCIEKYDTRKQARAAEKSILEENELKRAH